EVTWKRRSSRNPHYPTLTVSNLQSHFPDIPVTRKVRNMVPAGKVDVWSVTGHAGDQILARVRTGDDTGTDMSTLHPGLTLLQSDGSTPVTSTQRPHRRLPGDERLRQQVPGLEAHAALRRHVLSRRLRGRRRQLHGREIQAPRHEPERQHPA